MTKLAKYQKDKIEATWRLIQQADAMIYLLNWSAYDLTEEEMRSMIYSNEIIYISKYIEGRNKRRVRIIINGD